MDWTAHFGCLFSQVSESEELQDNCRGSSRRAATAANWASVAPTRLVQIPSEKRDRR